MDPDAGGDSGVELQPLVMEMEPSPPPKPKPPSRGGDAPEDDIDVYDRPSPRQQHQIKVLRGTLPPRSGRSAGNMVHAKRTAAEAAAANGTTEAVELRTPYKRNRLNGLLSSK